MDDLDKSIPLNTPFGGYVGSHVRPSRELRQRTHFPSPLAIRLRGKGGETENVGLVFLELGRLLLENKAADPREDKEAAAKVEDWQ